MRSTSATPVEYDQCSSPDPLASSMSSGHSPKLSSRRMPFSLAGRKHNATRTSVDNFSILPPSSPSRTVTEQTLSPWKIRVTVETEPEDQAEGVVQTMTRTVKVPLREESSLVQERSKRPQSRSRVDSAIKERQRSVTPTNNRRRRQSITNLDIVVLGDDEDDDEWGKKPKRSSPRKGRVKKTTPGKNTEHAVQASVTNFDVRPDTDAEDDGHMAVQDDSPELRQIDLNRVSVRSRANSTKQKMQATDDIGSEGEEEYALKPLPNRASVSRRTISANSAMTYPTPSPTASERGRSVEAEEAGRDTEDHVEGFDTIMESEGFTMIELDSIPSVKRMLSSPSGQMNGPSSETRSPTDNNISVRRCSPASAARQASPQPYSVSMIPPYLVLPEGESEISSTVPSSPPVFEQQSQLTRQKSPISHLQVPVQPRNRQVTPQPYSSPKLPSPPKQPTPRERLTPESVKAMKAGLALQGAVDPVSLYPVLPYQDHNHPQEVIHARSSSDELFEGFDSGTKRELRAGLRFGEELAKKQRPNVNATEPILRHEKDAPDQVWRGQSVLSRTPIQSLSDKHCTASAQDSPPSNKQNTKLLTPHIEVRNNMSAPDTELRREHEWQLERQAVSRRIQDASPSKVIVIDSDAEDEVAGLDDQTEDHQLVQDETMGDIWLEEAKDASSSPQQKQQESELSPQPKQHLQNDGREEFTEKPRRSLIPSPWKRGEQMDQTDTSTIITNGDEMSGLFWKQQAQDDVRFGAAAINNVRKEFCRSGESEFMTRRTSGAFDIEKMLGTPKRIRESLGKEQNHQGSSRVAHPDLAQSIARYEKEADPESEEYEDETSRESVWSDESDLTSQQKTVPVKFGDSFLTQSGTTPPPPSGLRVAVSPSIARPPTPRSAMKGSRQSLGVVNGAGVNLEGSDQAARRVIFAERSKGVDVEWVESSSSLQSPAEEVSSPIVEHQKHHEKRHLVEASPLQLEVEAEPRSVSEDDLVKDQTQTQGQKSWLSWLVMNKQQSNNRRTSTVPETQVDVVSESSAVRSHPKTDTKEDWAPTSRHSASPQSTTKHLSSDSLPRQHVQAHLPSYLSTPSYPSDPNRNTSSPLTTSKCFTNTHFRTLHILHRKSQRPRFHAPSISSCRPDIRDLVAKRWKLGINETESGLGGFEWTVGETEARVLERFCREVEFDELRRGLDQKELDKLVVEWCGAGGIWGGNVRHGEASVKWGWSVEQLATWLGRVVVGEVVREEEFGGRRYKG